MALTSQQQNFISEMLSWAETELRQRDIARNLAARWNLNGLLAKLDDESVQSVAAFEHLDAQKVIDGVSTLQIVVTTLGDDVSGQATNLIKLRG